MGSQCLIAERCTANNTCGGGPFPIAPDLKCNGFNPEGGDLGTLSRCATNSYDNNGYLTLDFTCDAATCVVDGDCPLVTTFPALQTCSNICCFHWTRRCQNDLYVGHPAT